MRSQPLVHPCPQCGKKIIWSTDNQWRPFCSERCHLVDFNKWDKEQYAISAENDYIDPDSED